MLTALQRTRFANTQLLAGSIWSSRDGFLKGDASRAGDGRRARRECDSPGGQALRLRRRQHGRRALCAGRATLRAALQADGGARFEYVDYDYDNRMIAGNTRDDGTTCGAGRLPLQSARRSQRRLHERHLEARPQLRAHRRSRAVRDGCARLSRAGHERALSPAAPAIDRGPGCRAARQHRGRRTRRVRRAAVLARGFQDEEGQRDLPRLQRFQRERRQDGPRGRRIRIQLGRRSRRCRSRSPARTPSTRTTSTASSTAARRSSPAATSTPRRDT